MRRRLERQISALLQITDNLSRVAKDLNHAIQAFNEATRRKMNADADTLRNQIRPHQFGQWAEDVLRRYAAGEPPFNEAPTITNRDYWNRDKGHDQLPAPVPAISGIRISDETLKKLAEESTEATIQDWGYKPRPVKNSHRLPKPHESGSAIYPEKF